MLKITLKISVLLLISHASNVAAMNRLNNTPIEVPQINLPAEIFNIIISNLNLYDQTTCDIVCQDWHKELHLKDIGVFANYDEFRVQFEQIKKDFDMNVNFQASMRKLRCARAKLNNKPEELFKFVKSLCPDIWSRGETSIVLKLVNKEFSGNEIAVDTVIDAQLDIKPVWIYLALLRAFDGYLGEGSDKIIKSLPVIKSITNEFRYRSLVYVMPDQYLLAFIRPDFDDNELCAEYCERKLDLFASNPEKFQKKVDEKAFFIGLGEVMDEPENISSKPSVSVLLNYGLDYLPINEKTALKILIVAYTKNNSVLHEIDKNILYKLALYSYYEGKEIANDNAIVFAKNALKNDPEKKLKAVVCSYINIYDSDGEVEYTRAMILEIIAFMYWEKKAYEKALKYYEAAILGLEDLRLNIALEEAGNICLELGQKQKAAEYFAKITNKGRT